MSVGLVSNTIEHHIVTRTKAIQKYKEKNPKKFVTKMSFEPKTKVELDPPKDDIISLDYLSKCDGKLS